MSLISRINNKLKFICGTNHEIARVMSFVDYLGKTTDIGYRYHSIESGRSSFVCPAQFIGESEVQPFKTSMPDTYWAELPYGSIIGGSSVVISNDGKLLYDMLAHRSVYEANMTDNGLCLIGGRPWHIGDYYIYNYLKKDAIQLPKAISLACNMSTNYYHFMLEVASRFYLLSLIGLDKDIPLVVDERAMSIPQMKEVVDTLNIDNRKLISIKYNQFCRVEKLYIISEPNVVIPNSFTKGERRTENFVFDIKALDYLKETLMKRITLSTEGNYPTRIFLSRKDCNKRKCNEDELEKVLSQFGFKSLATDNLTIAQQIALFSNAEHIIGGSGAAFTNLIYCKAGTMATFFLTGRRNATCFSSLGVVVGVKTFYVYPEVATNEIHADYYSINPNTIYNHLKNIYG